MITVTNVGLGIGIILFGSLVGPFQCLGEILWYTQAAVIQIANVILCPGVSLIGSYKEPLRRFRIIPRNSLAVTVEMIDIGLGLGVS